MKRKKFRRTLSCALTGAMITSIFMGGQMTVSASTGTATQIGWPSFVNLDSNVLQPGVSLDPSTNIRQAIYNKDAASGNGTSYYLDRVLNRPGNTSSDGNTVLTRGRSIFPVQSSVPTGLGWSNNIVWLDTANSFSPLNVITFKSGTTNVTFTEQVSSRSNNPSYWSSSYTTTNSAFSGVTINAKKFISYNNTAVVILDIVNNGASQLDNINFTVTSASCTTAGSLTNGQPEITGVKSVRANLTTLYPRTTADLNGQPCTLNGTTLTTPAISISAGSKAQLKVVTGITTKEMPESTTDYLKYAASTADDALKTQVQQFNKSYTDNIPYIDVPNKAIQKAIEYRWWLEQYNTFDGSVPGYDFQYPDTMEGVLGYNNNVVLSEGMRLQDTKWMRSAYLPYGTILNLGNSSMSSAFLDNPGKIANWNNHYGQYIAQSGLEAYKVKGGASTIAEEFANFFEDDAKGQLLHYGQHLAVAGRPTDAASNYGNAYLIAYRDAYMTGNDADTIDFAYPGAGTFKITPESAYVYAAADAAAELYGFVGDTAKANELNTLKNNIQSDALNLMWSDKNNSFEALAVAPTGSFVVDDPAKPNLIPWKVNNLYNFFSTNLVPQDPASVAKYGEAFKYFQYADEYPMFPCYTANQVDQKKYGGGTNNFSNINFTLQARAYEAALHTYDPAHKYVTPEMLSMLTAWQAYEVYPNSNGSADTRFPNNNEYFYNYDPVTKSYSRSGIYHDTLGNFNYIFIEDMAGIHPRMDNIIELDPIDFNAVNSSLPNASNFKYDHFMVNNIKYHDSDLSIVWDDPANPTPSYNAPQGYSLYVDGKRIFTVDHLAKILYNTQSGELTVDGKAVTADQVTYLKSGNASSFLQAKDVDLKNDINPQVVQNFKKSGIDLEQNLTNKTNLTQIPGTVVDASFTATARAASWFEKHRADGTDPTSKAVNEENPSPAAAIDGSTVGEPFWGTNASPNAKDWLQITFGAAQTFNNVKLYFYNDRDGFGSGTAGQGYAEPLRYSIQYLDGGKWVTVSNNNKTPLIPAANYNDALFDTVTSTALRITVQKNGNHPVAIAEAQVFNSPLVAKPVVNQPPTATASVGVLGNLSADLIGTFTDDGLPDDKNPTFLWNVVSAPAGASYNISNSNSMNATLIGNTAGNYIVKFTASDGQYSVENTVTVTLAKAASVDMATSAKGSAKSTASWENVNGPNNASFNPASSNPGTGKGWGNWSSGAPTWYQYTWTNPVYISSCDIYWYDDNGGTRVPSAWTIQYSDDGSTWKNVAIDVSTPYTGATVKSKYNNLKFAPITTKYLRVNITSITNSQPGTGICRWKVYGPTINSTQEFQIMTPIGTIPTLPSNALVTFDTGAMMSFPVTWDTITQDNVADENTLVVTGAALGTLVKANIYVRTDANVAQITDVWSMNISTSIGIAPVYPQFADISYNNGGRTNTVVPITWNQADKDTVYYDTAGIYTVKGTFKKGEDMAETTLTINVVYDGSPLALTRIKPVNVSTIVDTAPVLPSTVTELFNDGSTAQAAVTWDTIDQQNYSKTGPVSFAVQGTVDGTSKKAVANVTVEKAPELSPIGDKSIDEAQALTFTINALDPNGDTLTYSTGNLPAGASFDPVTHKFTWTPNYTQEGDYTIHFEVSDGVLAVSEDIIVTVNYAVKGIKPVNVSTIEGKAPVLPSTVTLIYNNGTTVQAAVTWEVVDPQTYSKSGPVNFIVKGNLDGTSINAVANVTVEKAPILTSIGNKYVDEAQTLSFTLNASDANGDTLTYSAGNLPAGASFDPVTHKFTWTPNYTQAGAYTIHFGVSDGVLAASEDITVIVNNVLPEDQINRLEAYINNLDLNKGNKNSLTSKLDQVLKLVGKDKANSINVLNAFINEVKGLSNDKLTTNQAEELTNSANEIILNITSSK